MKHLIVIALLAMASTSAAARDAQGVAEDLQKISQDQEGKAAAQRRREQLAASPTRERENPSPLLLVPAALLGLVLYAVRKK